MGAGSGGAPSEPHERASSVGLWALLPGELRPRPPSGNQAPVFIKSHHRRGRAVSVVFAF